MGGAEGPPPLPGATLHGYRGGTARLDADANPWKTFLAAYGNNRLDFVRHVLRVDVVEPWQVDELRALDEGKLRISIRSGHGVGKTAWLAWVIVHFVVTRFPCKVVVTAPTAAQLYDALAAECRLWVGKLPDSVRELLDVTTDHIALKAAPKEAFVSFRTSRDEQPEALQGVHSDNVLLVADEASGVSDKVFEAAGGSMSTRGAITILAGNPLRASGYFYSTHTVWSDRWACRRVACQDSSRVDPAYPVEIAESYGADSNAYRIRVLGEFPKDDDDAFMPLYLVEAAMGRDITEPLQDVDEVWGLDCARFGNDKSALAKRRGFWVGPIKVWHGLDTMQLVGAVKAAWEDTPRLRRPRAIYVDAIGLGAGVADRLRELELPAYDVNVSEAPGLQGPYAKLRDELWGRCKRWLERRNCRLPLDRALLTEMTVPKMLYSSTGKIKLESKDDMRARLKWSPDRADALMLTFAEEPAIAAGIAAGRNSSWSKPAKQPSTAWVI